MTKLIWLGVKLAVVLAFLFVGYNYFWGDEKEKENSRLIIGQVKTLTGSVVDLLKSEKGKFDQGKYEGALDKLQTTFGVIKDKAIAMGASGEATLSKLSDLEKQRADLVAELATLDSGSQNMGGISTRGADGNSAEDEALLQESADSIRAEILRLTSEAEVLSLDSDLQSP